MILELRDVRAGYVNPGQARAPFEVLHGVTVGVASGAIVGLLGPNGAGKSTLLKVAAGLLRPTAGTVRFGGAAGGRTAERARRGLCLLPEGRAVFRRLTVRENLAMFAGQGDVGAAIDEATAAFPILGERIDQRAGNLSGGEQQMLAVSRALIAKPAVVLADELSLGLAPAIVDQIYATVERLRATGTSLLVVEQYVERVLAIADYVYVLSKGRVVLVEEAGRARAGVLDQYLGGAA